MIFENEAGVDVVQYICCHLWRIATGLEESERTNASRARSLRPPIGRRRTRPRCPTTPLATGIGSRRVDRCGDDRDVHYTGATSTREKPALFAVACGRRDHQEQGAALSRGTDQPTCGSCAASGSRKTLDTFVRWSPSIPARYTKSSSRLASSPRYDRPRASVVCWAKRMPGRALDELQRRTAAITACGRHETKLYALTKALAAPERA